MRYVEKMERFALTGAPGGGKTAILRCMGPGVHCVPEPAREILAEQRATGGRGTPEQEPALFVGLLLRRSIQDYERAQTSVEPVLYDRGVPDCIGYAVHLGVDPTSSREAATRYRYYPEALVLEPWEAIYTTDDERTMTFAHSVEFHERLIEGYRAAGYTLIPVPRDTVERRAAFIRDFISRAVAAPIDSPRGL